ncbi:MAG: thioredoxin-dependent thiol peroxidase [Alphaproteobacteria bacterium]|nr:thioredoxin-dependent thiol peroxidase [Alphaproteobacteria bacterium]
MAKTSTVTAGEPAPPFTLPADGGRTVRLADLRGRKVVLYFYPKDDTPGCTKEAVGFTTAASRFAAAGAEIIGVSKDSVAKHDKFKAKHGLTVTLVSDDDGALCERYGVWIEKSLYGSKYMGIDRATFLIDEKGKVMHVWRGVKVSGHVEAVLAAVEGR